LKLGIRSERADIASMQSVTLAEAQAHLTELVRDIAREGELVITDADTPVARLSPVTPPTSLRHLRPTSVGAVLRPFPSSEDDPLDEMLDSRP
jgi:prevent-host-death family protein